MKGTLGIRYGVMAVSTAILVVVWLVPGPVERAADWMLWLAGALLGTAVLLAVVLPLAGMIRNPEPMLRSLAGLGTVAAVLGIGYLLSGGDRFAENAAVRTGGTMLYAVYILLGVAVLAVLTGEILRLFRK